MMSIQVKSLDEYKAKAELKKCPKIVRDYFRALNTVSEMKDHNLSNALKKIKAQAIEIRNLNNELKDCYENLRQCQ